MYSVKQSTICARTYEVFLEELLVAGYAVVDLLSQSLQVVHLSRPVEVHTWHEHALDRCLCHEVRICHVLTHAEVITCVEMEVYVH